MLCQVATPTVSREPLRMSKLPSAPWSELSADFSSVGNILLLVVTDEYSRYVIVEEVASTSATCLIPKLDKIFAEFGVPEMLKTDNGPPFFSYEFRRYAEHMGFKHRKITPLWPRANAETERFNRTLKKTVKGAIAMHLNWKQEMYRFLLSYRSTPHCTTGVPPATALFGRNLRTRLPELPSKQMNDGDMRHRDSIAKEKLKVYADSKQYVKSSPIQIGDPVLVRDSSIVKGKTPFEPVPLKVVKKNGSMLTAKRGEQLVTRNSSFFKKSPRFPTPAEVESQDSDDPEIQEEIPREILEEIPVETRASPLPRRSGRDTRLPRHLDDYVLQ